MRATFLAFAAGLSVLLPSPASAYCWGTDPTYPGSSPNFYSVPKEFGRSRYVAVVRAVAETWLDDDGKPKPLQPPFARGGSRPFGLADAYSGVFYDVEVVRGFKGRPPRRLRLFSENSTGRFWLVPGERYLAFISLTDTDFVGRRWSIDNCGNSAGLREAGATLRKVQALAHHRP